MRINIYREIYFKEFAHTIARLANPTSAGQANRPETHGRADVEALVQRQSGSRISSSLGKPQSFSLKVFN